MIIPILAVKDIDSSVAFYVEKLGFELDYVLKGAGGKDAFASVSLHGASLALELKPAVEPRSSVQFMVYVADGENIDDYYTSVVERGTPISEEIEDAFWGDRIFTVHDPDGYMITLCKTVRQVPDEEMEAGLRGEAQPV